MPIEGQRRLRGVKGGPGGEQQRRDPNHGECPGTGRIEQRGKGEAPDARRGGRQGEAFGRRH